MMRRLCLTFVVVAGLSSTAMAQKLIFDPATGIMNVDSQGVDLVAVFIEGPDVTGTCNLCDGENLPGTDALTASTWTLGFINGSSQWIRTNPLQGRGFVGVIAEEFVDGDGLIQPWPEDFPPFLDYPEEGLGIASYPIGTTCDDFGTFTYASDDGSSGTGCLICLPEPGLSGWLGVLIAGWFLRVLR
ncbi:MAG: hypothetical protein AAGF97_13175 [Planctomycetota bacterium]